MRAFVRLSLTLVLILTIAPALTGLADLAAKEKKSDKKKEKEEEKWDVNNPPGDWKEISIDTTETTWTNVDVSPDGTTIVFDMLGDIYTVPIAGGDAKALTSEIAWNMQPKFSPDGSRIAFISDRGGADNIWVMNADGSDMKAISEEKEHLVHNPAWSPDGRYIAAKKGFMSTRSIPAGEIWLFHAGGGGGLQLTERPNGPTDQKNMAEPSFSTDGRYVFYSQDITPGRVWQYNKDATGSIFAVKRLDRQTGETDVLVEGPGGGIRPTPSPDGKLLAFVKRTPAFTSAVYLKDLTSGKEWSVYNNLDRDLQETNGSQGNTPAIAWTPDSRSIVFWAAGKIRRVDVATKGSSVIPIHVAARKKVHEALRFPVDVAPDRFRVRMIRWAQMSPDGKRVLFQALGHVWVKDLDGGERRRLTTQTDHFEYYPRFSPDGEEVVFTTWDDQDLGSVRIVPVVGGRERILTVDPGHYIEPAFSPDGKTIAYRKIAGGYLLSVEWSMDPGIYTVPAGGGEPKRVSRSGFDPQFAGDGDRVFFSDEVEETKLVLKSVNLDGHDEKTHLKGDKANEFALSPDGRWIAFTEDYDAYVAPFTLTGRTVEIGSKSEAIPTRRVSARSGEFLNWSAGSDSLHWANGATLYTRALSDAFAFLQGSPEELPGPVEEGLDLSFEAESVKPGGRVVLNGARIVTMRDAENTQEVIDPGVIVVNGNRIEAVGRKGTVPVPDGAVLIDVTGKTIVPGLIDVHAHGAMARSEIIPEQNWMQFSNLSFGVTTIHDPSNDTSSIFAASELQRSGGIVAPRIFSTGTILYGAYAPGYTATVKSIDDALFHVRRLKDVGAISVKSYNQPRRDARQQIIEAGRQLGIMVVPEGGAKFQYNMSQVADGHTGIEHAIPIATGYEDTVQFWAGTEVGYTPTFGVAYGGLSGETYWYEHTNVWQDEQLMRFSPHFIVDPDAIRRTKAPDEHYNHFHVARFAKTLRDRGVSVQIGAHGQREGLAAHWEMWMMEQGGFTPWEALRGATIDGARYVGMDRDIGSIEPGKLADLAIIDGNPLENIRKSENVVYTMINGRLFDCATMNQITPEMIARQPFFFEKEGGDTIHPATQEWIDRFKKEHGWVH